MPTPSKRIDVSPTLIHDWTTRVGGLVDRMMSDWEFAVRVALGDGVNDVRMVAIDVLCNAFVVTDATKSVVSRLANSDNAMWIRIHSSNKMLGWLMNEDRLAAALLLQKLVLDKSNPVDVRAAWLQHLLLLAGAIEEAKRLSINAADVDAFFTDTSVKQLVEGVRNIHGESR